VEDGQTRLARATAAAAEILRDAGSRALVNLIWLDANPQAVFPDPGVNLDALQAQLARASVLPQQGDASAALRLALEQIGKGEGARELYLISDFQTTGWKGVEAAAPPNVTVFKVPAGAEEAANAGLAGLTIEPDRLVAGAEATITARVRNWSGAAITSTVYLEFGDARAVKHAELAPWGEASVAFRLPCQQSGLVPISATLSEDAFPADDRRYALAQISESLSVALLGEAAQAGSLWRRGVEALAWTDPVPLAANQAIPRSEAILAGRAPATQLETLLPASGEGALVVFQPNADWGPETWGKFGLPPGAVQNQPRDQPGWRLDVPDPNHALWRIFGLGEFGDPAQGAAWSRWNVAAFPEASGFSTLLRYQDGVPAVAWKKAGSGTLVFWNLPLEDEASDWVSQGAFLPVLGELLLSGSRKGVAAARDYAPGSKLTWTNTGAATSVKLLNEAGAEVASSRAADGSAASTDAPGPGSYRWLVDEEITERAVINFPDAESDLRLMNPAEAATGAGLPMEVSAIMANQRDGQPWWPMLLGLALALLLAEGWLGGAKAAVSKEGGAS